MASSRLYADDTLLFLHYFSKTIFGFGLLFEDFRLQLVAMMFAIQSRKLLTLT